MNSIDLEFMQMGLAAAREGANCGDVPVGAIIVCDGEVVGTGYNCREQRQNVLGHAELVAISEASRRLRSWRLDGCDIFVTLEPCIMCMGAILQARMSRLVFGCLDPKAGAVESLYRLCDDQRLNHQLPATGGLLAQESASLLSEFFARLRAQKRDSKNGEVAEPD